ncbi:hypothetical protein HMPREF0183_0772 [Brevibacterium mcbrellneri ATCC 49030]|uniref:Uncharacterized protein n=1 Tax=Brevibacterium mcbrellneri ATCC 49030 TaxID=585530 RepID=D4YLG2_9MICO|nr:hypothetical protein [Brevibacterium mcbrellneri]EFG47996.1 hypothetical protein HMPREF0183_0772 [Brevibacterium mcbrellneri ATCC 49030]
MVSIRGRLFEVLDRAVSDHWEDGLLADKNGVSAIATIVGVFFVVPRLPVAMSRKRKH